MSEEFTPTHIIVHHSFTKDDTTVSWQAIRNYHINTMGWLDIGYHFGIELVGNRYETLMGRPCDMIGAHCKEANMNRLGFGICCVGNFDDPNQVNFFVAQHGLESLVKLVRSLRKLFFIPMENIHRHGAFATYKTCPGSAFPWDQFMDAISRKT